VVREAVLDSVTKGSFSQQRQGCSSVASLENDTLFEHLDGYSHQPEDFYGSCTELRNILGKWNFQLLRALHRNEDDMTLLESTPWNMSSVDIDPGWLCGARHGVSIELLHLPARMLFMCLFISFVDPKIERINLHSALFASWFWVNSFSFSCMSIGAYFECIRLQDSEGARDCPMQTHLAIPSKRAMRECIENLFKLIYVALSSWSHQRQKSVSENSILNSRKGRGPPLTDV